MNLSTDGSVVALSVSPSSLMCISDQLATDHTRQTDQAGSEQAQSSRLRNDDVGIAAWAAKT